MQTHQQVRAGEMHLLQWARHLRRNRKSLKVTDPPFLGAKPKPQDEAHWRSSARRLQKSASARNPQPKNPLLSAPGIQARTNRQLRTIRDGPLWSAPYNSFDVRYSLDLYKSEKWLSAIFPR